MEVSSTACHQSRCFCTQPLPVKFWVSGWCVLVRMSLWELIWVKRDHVLVSVSAWLQAELCVCVCVGGCLCVCVCVCVSLMMILSVWETPWNLWTPIFVWWKVLEDERSIKNFWLRFSYLGCKKLNQWSCESTLLEMLFICTLFCNNHCFSAALLLCCSAALMFSWRK